jgi:hypothetical protein
VNKAHIHDPPHPSSNIYDAYRHQHNSMRRIHRIANQNNAQRAQSDRITSIEVITILTDREADTIMDRQAATEHNNSAPDAYILRMPPETRNRIYDAVLPQGTTVRETSHNTLPAEPAILRTCRQIRSEARGLYYARQCFGIGGLKYWEMKDPEAAYTALSNVGARLKMINRLEIHIFSKRIHSSRSYEYVQLDMNLTGRVLSGVGVRHNCGEQEVRDVFEKILGIFKECIGEDAVLAPRNRPALRVKEA